MYLNPAKYVIVKFGGVRATARAIGRSPASVCRWGKSGKIPSSVLVEILNVATKYNIDITANDLCLGRKVGKIFLAKSDA